MPPAGGPHPSALREATFPFEEGGTASAVTDEVSFLKSKAGFIRIKSAAFRRLFDSCL